MKIRILLTAALMAITASAFALSSEYTEWAQGPVQFLMTKEEVAQWKAITTDEEAKAFVALFWARRDPTPGTARNEYRERFDVAVEYADKNLGFGKRTKGSMTDRGKTLILYGQPKKVERSAPRVAQPGSFDDRGATADVSQWTQWIYEGEEAREILGVQRAMIRFIDRMGTNDFRAERGSVDLATAQQRAIAKSITQPALTVAPSAAPAPAAVAAPAPAPAPVVQTALTTASLAAAVDEFKSAKTNPYAKLVYASWGEYVTPLGESFVPVMLYVPTSAALPTTGLTFFGVVQDESGKNVLAFEEPATLSASKDDFYIDKSLSSLPGGKHRGIFGLAENGKPVAMVSSDMTLSGSLDKDAWAVSPLILSNNVYPMSVAQGPTDPFSFGGVKVIPKADQTFRPSDELWYFFELRNPGLAEPSAPAEGTAPATPVAATPKVQLKIEVEGTDTAGKKHKMAAPPREVDALEMKGVPGHYGVGSSIPLTTFAPGDYTFTVKVIDTIKKSSHTISEKFKVVP